MQESEPRLLNGHFTQLQLALSRCDVECSMGGPPEVIAGLLLFSPPTQGWRRAVLSLIYIATLTCPQLTRQPSSMVYAAKIVLHGRDCNLNHEISDRHAW